MTLGGYSQQITLFHPLPTEESVAIAPFPVLVFVASPNSGPYWLGPASSTAIAEQVSHFLFSRIQLDMSRLCPVRVRHLKNPPLFHQLFENVWVAVFEVLW